MNISRTAESYIPNTAWSDHSLRDAVSLALHCKIAHKINVNPSLLDKARNVLAGWQEQYDPDCTPECYREWEKILTLPWLDIAAILISVDEEGVRLRSSSPFVGILTEKEREQILEAFRS